MGCCGSKAEYEEEIISKKKEPRLHDTKNPFKAHTIELSDYEYSYTYSDSGETTN